MDSLIQHTSGLSCIRVICGVGMVCAKHFGACPQFANPSRLCSTHSNTPPPNALAAADETSAEAVPAESPDAVAPEPETTTGAGEAGAEEAVSAPRADREAGWSDPPPTTLVTPSHTSRRGRFPVPGLLWPFRTAMPAPAEVPEEGEAGGPPPPEAEAEAEEPAAEVGGEGGPEGAAPGPSGEEEAPQPVPCWGMERR